MVLKKGYIVMLLRNIRPLDGHCNGTRYIVDKMTNSLLFLRVAVGAHKGAKLLLPRMPCGPGDNDFPVPGFQRLQFPVRPCFAITTNKAQGQSFSGHVGLDLRSDCFTHGQLYVAMSRVTHPNNLTIITKLLDEDEEFEGKVRNIVYPEVLTDANSSIIE